MSRTIQVILAICLLSTLAWGSTPPSSPDYQKYWPQWRGPQATGVAPLADPPLEWNENKNVRWKVEIPGRGLASPIVWDNQVFILSAIELGKGSASASGQTEQQNSRGRRGRRSRIRPTTKVAFTVLALDRTTGKTLWRRTAREDVPHEGTHQDGSWAAQSAITDGEHLFGYFGSRGLYCYDLKGDLKWQTDLGDMTTRNGFGEGSSPVLYENTIVLNWDHEGPSFIVAFDKNTGKELWKVGRDEVTSWSTPIVVEHAGKAQVVTNATNRVRSYDLKTGELIWESRGMTVNTIPSPVSSDGMVFVMSGFRGSMLQAIRLADARGDITNSDAIVWRHERDTPYVPSPLLYGDAIYFVKVNQGIVSCHDARTGEPFYAPERLGDIQGIYASPVGASNRVYITGRRGNFVVLKQGRKFEVLATNSLADRFDASPAIVDKEIFLRGHKYLYCIAED